jgi:hypothetical protein
MGMSNAERQRRHRDRRAFPYRPPPGFMRATLINFDGQMFSVDLSTEHAADKVLAIKNLVFAATGMWPSFQLPSRPNDLML